ncbi:protein of unknown function [Micromonospora coxensis]|uniref:DUF1707 domain-containing protein n=2 Tax=Micromonospora coxensis TaxID=356852 RepID=A0A1C5ICF8_9ACTN|nr:protein of unknown function [Micromonospora coxensis]
MRATDGDRQTVADRLRVAVDEGRLSLAEYDERLQRAYGARTYGELDAVLADLPGARVGEVAVPDRGLPAVPGPGEGRRSATAAWLVALWEPYLKVVGIVVAVWAVTGVLAGELLYFWPGWVAGPWGAVLLVRTVGGLASGEPRRRAAKRDRRRRARAAKRDRRRQARAVQREHRRRELTD